MCVTIPRFSNCGERPRNLLLHRYRHRHLSLCADMVRQGAVMGLFHGTPRVFSSEGKLNMEASRLGSYVGGRRGLACFCLIWHASWLIDWGRAYGTAVFDWYVKAVVSVHPFAPKLDLKGISFVEYATVYFYVLAGLAPLFGIFCLVASFLHFRASSYGQNIRVSGLMMVANLVVFSAMIGGLAYLAYLDAD